MGGRKRKEINFEQAEKLAGIQCTMLEIASFFDMTDDTLRTRLKENYGLTFQEWFDVYSSPGKISIRREQFRMAEKGSVPMLIWLGKQYCGQSDKIDKPGREELYQLPESLRMDEEPETTRSLS